MTLSVRHERWVHSVLAFVYVTGIAWLVLHYGVNGGARLEDAWQVAESWMLRAHGAAAMLALIVFGSMLASHVPAAWALRRNLASGVWMFAAMALLAATGWLLYYASGEWARAWVSYVHMAVGVAGPLALAWHLAYRRRIARLSRQKGGRWSLLPSGRRA
jgi:hypothetical protein